MSGQSSKPHKGFTLDPVTIGQPTVTRSKADPGMGIEQRQFLVCRDSSIRSSRTRTGSAKKGRGRTGSTGPHAGDGARVEAKTQNSHDWYRSYGNKQIPSGALPLSDSWHILRGTLHGLIVAVNASWSTQPKVESTVSQAFRLSVQIG